MDCPDEKIGAIANSQRSDRSKEMFLSNWLAFFWLLFFATKKSNEGKNELIRNFQSKRKVLLL
jgi:hypothetical protein